MANALTPRKSGIMLRVHLTPRASKDEVIGLWEASDGEVIKARVKAIAEKGKANQALIKLFATWVNLPRSDISLVSGHKSRFKTLHLAGNANELCRKISNLLGGNEKQKPQTKLE